MYSFIYLFVGKIDINNTKIIQEQIYKFKSHKEYSQPNVDYQDSPFCLLNMQTYFQ